MSAFSCSRPRLHSTRLVLFPQGQLDDAEDREQCTRLAIAAGGDVARFLDSPVHTLDRFIEYVSRIRDIGAGQVEPIVVLTKTNPLPLAVLNTRRRLERAIPTLHRALWLIYLRPEQDPFFDSSAALGWLVGELHTAPVWVGPNMDRFVVISRRVEDPMTLRSRVASLLREAEQRKRRSDPPARRLEPTPRSTTLTIPAPRVPRVDEWTSGGEGLTNRALAI